MRKIMTLGLVGYCFVAAACSDTAGPTGAGSAAGSAGTPASAGTGGGATVAGSSSGGAGAGMAGSSTAGSATAGSAGSPAGAGGMSGAGGSGGSGEVPKASAGCGKANPVSGARTIQTGGKTGNYNVFVPAGYDPNTPMPLGFGFHGFGNDECGPDQGECRGFKMLPAVTVYMKSLSDGWEQQDILEANVTYWQDVLAVMKNEYCIDENKVFIAGVSSGGQFIENLTCRFGDTLWQTTAVSASVVNGSNQNCKGTPPVLVIHGVTDQAGTYGEGVVEKFAKLNGCPATAPPGLAQAKTDMMTAFNAKEAKHVCMDMENCSKNPVRFCLSSQITYSGLTHGWPMVGGELIGDFQATLK